MSAFEIMGRLNSTIAELESKVERLESRRVVVPNWEKMLEAKDDMILEQAEVIDGLRQIVGRLATALMAGGVPREDVERITGADAALAAAPETKEGEG